MRGSLTRPIRQRPERRPVRKITVTVADSHLASIDDVARRLRAAGMQIDSVLPAIGIITGSVAHGGPAAIGALPGVAAVEDQTTFQIPPPDADVQ